MNVFIPTFLLFTYYWSLYSAQQYQPNWDSLDSRPLPLWYDEAKFGIFTHWGVYSVPAQHEWFWYWWTHDNNTAHTNFVEFMATHYKPNTTYQDMAREFTAIDFDADVFANIIKSSGAKYYVLTTKHHEGFTLWPSNVSWNWNAMDVGPHRDLVGEIRDAIHKVGGLKWGTYFSMADWFHPFYLQDAVNGVIMSDQKKSHFYPDLVLYPQWLDLITNYQPDILWSDGDWGNTSYYRATEFLAWLYNESPVKDTIIVNDRWGYDAECKHGGFLTCSDRYLPGTLQKRKWEDANSIDCCSWGFRSNMNLNAVLEVHLLISSMIQVWATGGNFLLNFGPDHNGRVIPIFEERLAQIGAFINAHEEAIFGSKPWIFQSDNNLTIWYTSQLRNSTGFDPYRILNPQIETNTIIYPFVTYWPVDNLIPLAHVIPTSNTIVSVFTTKGFIQVNYTTPSSLNGGIQVDIGPIPLVKFPVNYALGLKIEYAADQKLSCPEGFTQSTVNTNKCYKILNTPLSYANADKTCRNVSDSFISIDNTFENADIACKNNFKIQIKNLANLAKTSCQSAYIGLEEVGTTWYWANRDLSAYRNWASNNPSTDPSATCAVINTSTGKWTNQDCSTPQCAVCVYALE